LLLLLLPAVVDARYVRQGETGPDLREPHSIFATYHPYIFYHNVGLLEILVSNVGVLGNPWRGLDSFGAGWRGGEYLYAAAVWVGAVASDNLTHVSTGFAPTPLRDLELLPTPDPVDTVYPSYEGVFGGNRVGFSPEPDDDNDGLTDEDFHNGKDDDGDGLIDEDFEAISQQMFSSEYWDYAERAIEINPEHRPLNIRVQQRSFAWSTPGSNEFVGVEFTIWNDGFETLREVYIGFFVDSDAGPRDGDYAFYADDAGRFESIDTVFVDHSRTDSCGVDTLRIDMCYMYDVPDDGQSATGGDVDGFFGGMFLGHTTDPTGTRAPERVGIHTAHFFSSNAPYPDGDPKNDFERYDLLSRGTLPNRPASQPNDYRYVFSAGPFAELLPGESLTFQTAFVAGKFRKGMVHNAMNAQRIYNGIWRDVDEDPRTGVDCRETCLRALDSGEPVWWRDPCRPQAPPIGPIKDTECLPHNYVDADCDCCTPDPLCPGCEALVHWVGSVAPPPPNTNMDHNPDPGVKIRAPGGDRRATVEWDNSSELAADPISGEILFTGYRVYRVEGWMRPTGSIGPAAEEWQLLADLSWEPKDSLGEASPLYLGHYVKHDVECTEPVRTGSSGADSIMWYCPVGRYSFEDANGLKNGMLYFYDVTAYSTVLDTLDPGNPEASIEPSVATIELESRPTAVEDQSVIPVWEATTSVDDIFVVPNPYIRGEQPMGWDLNPSDRDPTGTKIAFVNLPRERCEVKIFTLAGDLVQLLDHDPAFEAALGRESNSGTAFWNLVSRNGQDVVSGVYLYAVRCDGGAQIGRFVIIR
jgi:hypothetical protein